MNTSPPPEACTTVASALGYFALAMMAFAVAAGAVTGGNSLFSKFA